MTDARDAVGLLPIEREPGRPFDPPRELRERDPIEPYPFAGGHEGWLITGYDQVRAVLADSRFSNRKELMRHPHVDMGDAEVSPAPPGEFLLTDDPEHNRYRKLLAGKFTVRRMRLLTARVEQVTATQLDSMETAGPRVDLVTAFAKPIPAIMTCELLGVPYDDRESFQTDVDAIFDADSQAAQLAGYHATRRYVLELVAAKRVKPTDDVLSELTDTDLSDEEIQGIGLLLLAAGLDTTASMLALGTFALLRDRRQWTRLREAPDNAERAVEELLRYLSVAKTFMRSALEDVEVGGQTIKAGATVILSYHAANRDPRRFEEPDTLDITRQAGGHLAFGHGIHQCLGQQLARIEMRVALPALAERFGSLRLDTAADNVDLRPESADIFGVRSLPVTWEG